jgi:hypothetical protein
MEERLDTDRKSPPRQPMRGPLFYVLLFGAIIVTWILAVYVTHM